MKRKPLPIAQATTLFAALFCLTVSCTSTPNEDYAKGADPAEIQTEQRQERIDNSLAQANKIISEKEEQRIASFIDRMGWKPEKVSGVYIEKTLEGSGKEIDEQNTVTIEYRSYYLTGESAEDFCPKDGESNKTKKAFGNKESKKNEKSFKVSSDTGVIYGLQTAVKHLKTGSKARVIVPDNLAFYIDENGEKIKANATLVFEIVVKKIK